jgi:hypothetical protein
MRRLRTARRTPRPLGNPAAAAAQVRHPLPHGDGEFEVLCAWRMWLGRCFDVQRLYAPAALAKREL